MEINFILENEVQDFISKNIDVNVTELAFQKNKYSNKNWLTILNQIAAKQKAKTKLPTWFATKKIIYPSKISVEQTSSEKTAFYKSQLVSGESLIDLTGGFGVDDYYFAKKIKNVFHCEINEELSEIVKHNFYQLKSPTITCLAGDSKETLRNLNQKFDWIYIDPSRRNEAKGKVFMLKDCLPNVPELLDFYFEFSSKIMIKAAPILDITAGLSELKNVSTIHIIAVENEVKELLWMLEKESANAIEITTFNIQKEETQKFSFEFRQSNKLEIYSLPKKYLYEPNAAIMKSGGFNVIPSHYIVEKLHSHSHLYTSDSLIDFPGRVFEVKNSISYSKTDMKQFLENKKANITTRNFPYTVETIRKKWKIKDGGSLYCFFTTDLNNHKIVLLCDKLK